MSDRPGQIKVVDGAGVLIGYATQLIAPGGEVVNGVLTLPGVSAGAFDALSYKGASAPSATEFNYLAGVTSAIQAQFNLKAPLASPALTGTPTAPTASAATNTTQIATTAFVQTAVSNLINSAPGALDTLDELAAALGDDANFAATVTTSLAGKQPLDAGLTALAVFNTNGLLVQTADNTFAGRTLAAPAAGFTITNPAGTAGNPTFALANDLAAAEALAGTGIIVRSATDTWTLRQIIAPAAGLAISDPSGTAGNPTISLANDLAALEALASTGLAVRTGTDTWVQRSVAAGTGISVSNGNGVGGDPTVTNTGVTSITGTANQITASAGTGAVTLSLPQNIHTGASPTFAGATFTGDVLLNAATANLFLKDTSTGWKAGATTVITPQANNAVRSTSYTSGLLGWNVSAAGDAEFNNIRARGEIASSVFKVSEISATAGTLGVFFSASTLRDDVTTPASTSSSFSFNAKNSDAGGMLFAVGDVVRFKTWTGSGISDSWATITGRTNNTTYTAYTATLNSGSTSATFRAGSAVVDYGPSGTGFITLSADGTVGSSPNLSMATHAGSPWSTVTPLLRLGNLNGAFGYATDIYGFGTGQYGAASKSWITVDQTNGIRLGNNTTVLGQWDTAGAITVGEVAVSKSNVLISSGALSLRNNTTARINLSAAGVLTINDSAGAAVITLDASAGAEITKKLTMPGANSAIAIGSTPPTSAAAGTGLWLDRTGLYGLASSVVQAKIDAATGAMLAGGVTLDVNGISIPASASGGGSTSPASLKWLDGGNLMAEVFGYRNSNTGRLYLNAYSLTTNTNSDVYAWAQNSTGGLVSNFHIASVGASSYGYSALFGTGTYRGLCIGSDGVPDAMLDVRGAGIFTGSLVVNSSSITSGFQFDVNGFARARSGLVIGAELGGYVISGNHRLQVVATGTQSIAMFQGGSGVVEIWKDTTPTKAVSFGMAVPGGTITDDFIVSAYSNANPSPYWFERLRVSNAGALKLSAYGAGTLTTDASGNVTASSDDRLKTKVGDFTDGLAAVLQLEPISYRWKHEAREGVNYVYHGYSAQNIRQALPGAVGKNADGTLTVDRAVISAAHTNAIKELAARVAALEALQ